MTLIITFTFILSKFIYYLPKKRIFYPLGLSTIFGLFSVLAMIAPNEFQGMVFDLRTLPIFFVTFVFGGRYGLLAGIFPAIFRMYIGGPSVVIGIFHGLLIPIIVAAAISMLFKKKHDKSYIPIGLMVGAFTVQILVGIGIWAVDPFLPAQYFLMIKSLIYLTTIPGLIIMGIILNGETKKRKLEAILYDALDKIKLSERHYRLLAQNSTDMISLHSLDGTYQYCSPACEDLLGYQPEELVGHSAYEFFHPEDLEVIARSHQHVANTPDQYTISYRIQKKDGTFTWFETTSQNMEITPGKKELIAVSRDITNRKELEFQLLEANKMLEDMSTFDGLTGIRNRRSFNIDLEEFLEAAALHKQWLSLLLIDVDLFKKYNDYYGHLKGDECLQKVATLMKNSLPSTIHDVYRFGGEEFALLLPGSNPEEAYEIAERIRTTILQEAIPHDASNICPFVTVSIGINSVEPSLESLSPSLLIEGADKALYESKQTRNTTSLAK